MAERRLRRVERGICTCGEQLRLFPVESADEVCKMCGKAVVHLDVPPEVEASVRRHPSNPS